MKKGFFNNSVTRVLELIADAALLTVYWLVTSIPIFTIGASTAAVYQVMLQLFTELRIPVWSRYKECFRQNFKQATFAWLILLFCGIDLCLMGYTVYKKEWISPILENPFAVALIGMIILLYVFILTWIFPEMAKFDTGLKQHFINALALSFRHLPTTLLFILTAVAMIVLCYVAPIFIFVSVGFVALLNTNILRGIFAKYLEGVEAPPEKAIPEGLSEEELYMAEMEAMDREMEKSASTAKPTLVFMRAPKEEEEAPKSEKKKKDSAKSGASLAQKARMTDSGEYDRLHDEADENEE